MFYFYTNLDNFPQFVAFLLKLLRGVAPLSNFSIIFITLKHKNLPTRSVPTCADLININAAIEF